MSELCAKEAEVNIEHIHNMWKKKKSHKITLNKQYSVQTNRQT